MADLDHVYRGQSVTTDAEFYDSSGNPFPATSPAQYKVFDYNHNLIVNGSAQQDAGNPARWYASFSVPNTAPISDSGQKYSLVWAIANNETSKTATEYFLVKLEDDPLALENGQLVMAGGRLTDTLIVEDQLDEDGSIRLLDEEGNELMAEKVVDKSTFRQVNGDYYYDFDSGSSLDALKASNVGVTPFFTEWKYKLPTRSESVEIHPVYVVSPKMYMFIDGVRRIVDKARNEDINPNLRYTDIDLAHYVIDGIQRINRENPQFTGWTVQDIPQQFYDLAKKSAAVEALRAQYLAEGVAAFDFQGQAVQLNVDRTQYIDRVMESLNSELSEKIPRAKKLFAKTQSAGVLNINVGPNTSYPSFVHPRERLMMFRGFYGSYYGY